MKVVADEVKAGKLTKQTLDALNTGDVAEIVLRNGSRVASDGDHFGITRNAEHALKLTMRSRHQVIVSKSRRLRVASAADKCGHQRFAFRSAALKEARVPHAPENVHPFARRHQEPEAVERGSNGRLIVSETDYRERRVINLGEQAAQFIRDRSDQT